MGQFGGGLSSRHSLWGHWLRAAGHCVVMSGLSSILEGIANTKLSEWSIALANAASVAPLRFDSTTGDTSSAVETAQLPNAVRKQLLSSVFFDPCAA